MPLKYVLKHIHIDITYTYVCTLEKAMAPHSSTLAWKNPMDGGAWWAAVHGVARNWT